MSARGAAPEGGSSGSGYISGVAPSIAQLALPPPILERLAAEGITTLEQWIALGRKRYLIFGVIPSVVRQIDELARGAQVPSRSVP